MDVIFEWYERENHKNQQKYGIAFEEAHKVFRDPHKLVVKEIFSGSGEARWFCVGTIGNTVVKVGFTYQAKKINILWGRIVRETAKAVPPSERTTMNLPEEDPPRLPGETAIYEDDPFALGEIDDEESVVVENFLPPPEELVFRPKEVEVILTLREESLIYFKEQGKRFNIPYQSIIRNLIDEYVKRQRTRPES